MSRTVNVSVLPDNRLRVTLDQFTLTLDRPVSKGGQGNEPSPMDLFLMAIAGCSTFYAMAFAEQRSLPTAGMSLRMDCEYDKETGHYTALETALNLPADFPEKYVNAVGKAMEACTVKKHIANPPVFSHVVERV